MKTKQAFNPYLPSWEYVPDAEPHIQLLRFVRMEGDYVMDELIPHRQKGRMYSIATSAATTGWVPTAPFMPITLLRGPHNRRSASITVL